MRDKTKYTHFGRYCRTDGRGASGMFKVLLRRSGRFWESSLHGDLYKQSDGLPEKEFPVWKLLLETIRLVRLSDLKDNEIKIDD